MLLLGTVSVKPIEVKDGSVRRHRCCYFGDDLRGLVYFENGMKLQEQEFIEAVEKFKALGDNGKQLELWLTHGLPIYTNHDELIKLYDAKYS